MATERAHDGGLGRSWRRTGKPRRLSGVGSELGGALGSQGGGECYGWVNLARGGPSTVNFEGEARRDSSAWNGKTRGAAHTGAQRGGGSEPGVSTSPGGTGSKQLRACTHARGAARAAAALDRGR